MKTKVIMGKPESTLDLWTEGYIDAYLLKDGKEVICMVVLEKRIVQCSYTQFTKMLNL